MVSKFLEKLLGDTFKDISNRTGLSGWISTKVNWLIDSKERKYQFLDKFLKEQIVNPDSEVLKLAKDLRKGTKNFDELIIKILKYVYDHVNYRGDDVNFGKTEYWATCAETLKKGYDDCDGINGAIYVLMRLACGEMQTKEENKIVVPLNDYFFSCIGDVILSNGSSTGHFWLIYFSPKIGEWYPIDGTYYPDFKEISKRLSFKLDNKYKEVWFYFNERESIKQK